MKKEIKLLNGCIIKLSDWNECVMFKSPKELNDWEGVVSINVDYPFEKGETVEIEKGKEDYWSTETLITAIRDTLKMMYEHTRRSETSLYNDRFDGPYGVSYHSLEELWLESMTFDPDKGKVSIYIGS